MYSRKGWGDKTLSSFSYLKRVTLSMPISSSQQLRTSYRAVAVPLSLLLDRSP